MIDKENLNQLIKDKKINNNSVLTYDYDITNNFK